MSQSLAATPSGRLYHYLQEFKTRIYNHKKAIFIGAIGLALTIVFLKKHNPLKHLAHQQHIADLDKVLNKALEDHKPSFIALRPTKTQERPTQKKRPPTKGVKIAIQTRNTPTQTQVSHS